MDLKSIKGAFNDLRNGVTNINVGGTHEANKNGGVPVGVAPDGTPNLVEQGEVILDNENILSNRNKITAEYADTPLLKKHIGQTYADAFKEEYDKIKEHSGSSTFKNELKILKDQFFGNQEYVKQKANEKKVEAQAQMSPEQIEAQARQDADNDAAQQQMLAASEMQQQMAAQGGIFAGGGTKKTYGKTGDADNWREDKYKSLKQMYDDAVSTYGGKETAELKHKLHLLRAAANTYEGSASSETDRRGVIQSMGKGYKENAKAMYDVADSTLSTTKQMIKAIEEELKSRGVEDNDEYVLGKGNTGELVVTKGEKQNPRETIFTKEYEESMNPGEKKESKGFKAIKTNPIDIKRILEGKEPVDTSEGFDLSQFDPNAPSKLKPQEEKVPEKPVIKEPKNRPVLPEKNGPSKEDINRINALREWGIFENKPGENKAEETTPTEPVEGKKKPIMESEEPTKPEGNRPLNNPGKLESKLTPAELDKTLKNVKLQDEYLNSIEPSVEAELSEPILGGKVISGVEYETPEEKQTTSEPPYSSVAGSKAKEVATAFSSKAGNFASSLKDKLSNMNAEDLRYAGIVGAANNLIHGRDYMATPDAEAANKRLQSAYNQMNFSAGERGAHVDYKPTNVRMQSDRIMNEAASMANKIQHSSNNGSAVAVALMALNNQATINAGAAEEQARQANIAGRNQAIAANNATDADYARRVMEAERQRNATAMEIAARQNENLLAAKQADRATKMALKDNLFKALQELGNDTYNKNIVKKLAADGALKLDGSSLI